MAKPNNAKCSFCKKTSQEVGPLVEGPDQAYICGDCISLCQSILVQETLRRKFSNGRDFVVDASTVRKALDGLVKNHDEAKAALVTGATSCAQGKGRTLLLGSSCASAMFLAKAVAHALEVPFAMGDPSNLGTRGPGDPAFNLLSASEFDVKPAQHGVLFLTGMERPEAQDVLLRIWQDKSAKPLDGLDFDTREVLFVCGATYAGLDEADTLVGRHREQPITEELLTRLGVRAGWASAMASIARVSPLDEQTLMRVVEWVNFPREEAV